MPRPRLLPDLTPFRDSRDLRLVVGGDFISGMGAQAALVALPYQLYEHPPTARTAAGFSLYPSSGSTTRGPPAPGSCTPRCRPGRRSPPC